MEEPSQPGWPHASEAWEMFYNQCPRKVDPRWDEDHVLAVNPSTDPRQNKGRFRGCSGIDLLLVRPRC